MSRIGNFDKNMDLSRIWYADIGCTKLRWILHRIDIKVPFVIILILHNQVMLLLNWPLGIVVQLLQWRIRPLWHVYERDKLLSWLQKKITITRLRVHTRQVIDKIIIAPCMCGVVNRTPFKIGTIPILRQHIFGLFGPHQPTLSA